LFQVHKFATRARPRAVCVFVYAGVVFVLFERALSYSANLWLA